MTCTNVSATTIVEQPAVAQQVRAEQSEQVHQRASSPSRRRRPSSSSDTISSEVSGSSGASAGWVPARVRPRRRCAACDRVAPQRGRGRARTRRRARPCRRTAVDRGCRPRRAAAARRPCAGAGSRPRRRGGPRGGAPRSMASNCASTVVGVERGLDDRRDQRLLVGEDPEDRALGDAGGLGDLAGGERGAVREQQREGGLDDAGPPLLGRERGGPGSGRLEGAGGGADGGHRGRQ